MAFEVFNIARGRQAEGNIEDRESQYIHVARNINRYLFYYTLVSIVTSTLFNKTKENKKLEKSREQYQNKNNTETQPCYQYIQLRPVDLH